ARAPPVAGRALATAVLAPRGDALLVAAEPALAMAAAAGRRAVPALRRVVAAGAGVVAVVDVPRLAPGPAHGLCAGRALCRGTWRLVDPLVALRRGRQAAGPAAGALPA